MTTTSQTDRAALALVALGPERAANVLRSLPEHTAVELAARVARLGPIDATVARDVLADVASALGTVNAFSSGGPSYVREIMARAYGDERAMSLATDAIAHPGNHFEYLEDAPPTDVVRLLAVEPPPIITLVVAHLSPARGAQVLALLPEDVRADVGLRLAQPFVHVLDLHEQPALQFDRVELAQLVRHVGPLARAGRHRLGITSGPQHGAGQGTGGCAVATYLDTTDEHRGDPVGVGDQPGRARGKVVARPLGPVVDGRRVEHHQVGVPAGHDPAAFGQPV